MFILKFMEDIIFFYESSKLEVYQFENENKQLNGIKT
jgi:hypothetical protein